MIANVIAFPLLWKYCLVIWLNWWQEEVRAEFLLHSLRGEGQKRKTCEGLCDISLPLDLDNAHVTFLNGPALLEQLL